MCYGLTVKQFGLILNFKKEESAGTQLNENKNKWNVQRMFLFI